MKVLGIPVVFDPQVTTGAQARGFWPMKTIAVGPSWYALPGEERAAILLHEAHHCRAFHMEARVLMLPLLFAAWAVMEICRRHELAADRRAVASGFGAHLRAYLARTPRPESHFYPSTAERVAAIDRFMKEQPCRQ